MRADLVTKNHCKIYASYLCSLYRDPQSKHLTLNQSRITDWCEYNSFAEFVTDLWRVGRYPTHQSHKFETNGWTPTLFETGERRATLAREAKYGHWREGRFAADEVTMLCMDLDNARADSALVRIDQVVETLVELGVQYALYTSFSHTPDQPKLRIVLPISRPATWDEAFQMFAYFDSLWNHQLDSAIYDRGDFLYGPPFRGERCEQLRGGALNVDALLNAAAKLSIESRPFRKRHTKGAYVAQDLTAEELALLRKQAADHTVRAGVSIADKRYFNPNWLPLIDSLYMGGSHMQTLFGLLGKVWAKSGANLSYGEMDSIMGEIDARMNFYCSLVHGRRKLVEALQKVMSQTVSPRAKFVGTNRRNYALEAAVKRRNRISNTKKF